MPERGFATEIWDDDWFQDLSRDQRYLFVYLWTNVHCNPSGLYHITLTTMSFESKFSKEELPELLQSLSPKVIWYQEHKLIWVKNFLKRQSKSSKFLAAAAKALTSINHNGAIHELLDYNLQRYNLSIPYQYYSDKVSIPSSAGAGANAKADIGRGGEDPELAKISQLFEENIGMLSPVAADRLRDIAQNYPPGWFGEALGEAVASEHRNLKYIEAILERWKVEGFKAPRGKIRRLGQVPSDDELDNQAKQKGVN